VPSTASIKYQANKTMGRIIGDSPSLTPWTFKFFSKDNFLKRHSNKHVVFRQRLLPAPRFPSGLLDIVQLSYAMRTNTFVVSKILERKGERYYFILHHENELSILHNVLYMDTLSVYLFKRLIF
jgi:hypothetical protein